LPTPGGTGLPVTTGTGLSVWHALQRFHAEMGDPDQACDVGRQALQAVRLAPSQRTAASLRALRGALIPYRARPEVMELRQLVAEALP